MIVEIVGYTVIPRTAFESSVSEHKRSLSG